MLRSIVLVTVLLSSVVPAAAQQTAVGLLPFDVVSVSGAGREAGANLAKLLRVEMIRARKVRPVLLDLPADARTPVEANVAAQVGKAGGAALVVSGTVIEATESHSSNSAHSGGLLGAVGVGGSVSKSTAHVSLNVDLIDAETGESVQNFEVDAKNTDLGVGADFSTALGGADIGGAGWDKSPMAKALREAARKINDEVAKVAASRKR
jgi:curli biogenesis system outer membrane secretion channel CsgG